MAASLSGFVLLPNPNVSFYGAWADATSLSSTAAAHRGLDPARSPLTKTCLGARLVLADRKPSKFIVLAASHEESVSRTKTSLMLLFYLSRFFAPLAIINPLIFTSLFQLIVFTLLIMQ